MNVLVGGGSGFIGTALVKTLKQNGYVPRIISRRQLPNSLTWDELRKTNSLPDNTYAVVNLAGANLADYTKKWDAGYSKEVYDSRINTTKQLADLISNTKQKPKVFLTTSAVGYYSPSNLMSYTEESEGGDENDFFCRLCKHWEMAAKVSDPDVRQVIIRLGLVLGNEGGLIAKVFWPFYFGLGGPTGSGNQTFPWIHIDDVCGFILHALKPTHDHVKGVYNAVSPVPCLNKDFSQAYASALWRPQLFGSPEFVIRKMFDPERARLMLTGQFVTPKRTLESGYRFKFYTIDSACKDLAAHSFSSFRKEKTK